MLSSLASAGLLPPLYNRRRACEDVDSFLTSGPGQDSSQGSSTKLGPQLGSYEGCSFICSSLRPRREGTAKSGSHFREFSQDGKHWGRGWWRKMEGGEADRRAAVTLASLLARPAAALPFSPHLLVRPALTPPSPTPDSRAAPFPASTRTITLITLHGICSFLVWKLPETMSQRWWVLSRCLLVDYTEMVNCRSSSNIYLGSHLCLWKSQCMTSDWKWEPYIEMAE